MRSFGFLLLIALFASSCGGKKAKEAEATPAKGSNTVYYPINDYIRRQIKDIDTTPYYLYRLQITDGKKDSSIVKRSDFDAAIKSFLLPELEDASLRQNFTESVFDDESTNSITLTYSQKNKSGIVQNASVLLNKENQEVKWIFINTLNSAGDSSIIQRISWKGNESCTLNTSITYSKKPEQQRRLSFVWNEKKE